MLRSARITVPRPSASMICAILALFIALGGTGYAATKMSGKNLYKRSVPADRIQSNSLTGTQIIESKLGTVPRAKLAESADSARLATTAETARTADTATNAVNAQSAANAQTAVEATRLQGREATAVMSSGVQVRSAQTAPVPGINNGFPAEIQANCAAGERGISGSGGWFFGGNSPTSLNAPVTVSMPVLDANGVITGWRVHGRNLSGVDRYLRAYVVCVPVTP